MINDQERNQLTKRASLAFDAEFRAKLADAVTWFMLTGRGGEVGTVPPCRCPLGCLIRSFIRRPLPRIMAIHYPRFRWQQFGDFIHCFDLGAVFDNDSPESALGLLYRARFS